MQQDGSGVRAVVERELRVAGVRPRDLRVVAELGLQESAKSAVEAGLGVTFMSRLAIEREIAEGRFDVATVAGIEPGRLFYCVRSGSRPLSRLTRTFLEFARGAARPASRRRGRRPAPAGARDAGGVGAVLRRGWLRVALRRRRSDGGAGCGRSRRRAPAALWRSLLRNVRSLNCDPSSGRGNRLRQHGTAVLLRLSLAGSDVSFAPVDKPLRSFVAAGRGSLTIS